MAPPEESRPSLVLAWLRLCRAPNVFTAIADITMGYLVARQQIDLPWVFAALAAASACLYTAGMVLNDVFDIEVDRKERPFRPLPSGQISLAAARAFGFGLLLVGVALGIAAPFFTAGQGEVALPWRSGVVAIVLALCVLLYDGYLKKKPIGPLGMGLCRFFNVLLGMSAAKVVAADWPLGFDAVALLPAAGIGLYITGVTWFARSEAGQSQTRQLLGGMLVMTAGVALLGWWMTFPRPVGPNVALPNVHWFWALLAIMLTFVHRRCIVAALDPTPVLVQAAVKNCIFSLILFDASLCAVSAPPVYSLAVAALLAPMILLGAWVYST